jgi:hypothetical protein
LRCLGRVDKVDLGRGIEGHRQGRLNSGFHTVMSGLGLIYVAAKIIGLASKPATTNPQWIPVQSLSDGRISAEANGIAYNHALGPWNQGLAPSIRSGMSI